MFSDSILHVAHRRRPGRQTVGNRVGNQVGNRAGTSCKMDAEVPSKCSSFRQHMETLLHAALDFMDYSLLEI